MKKDKTTLFKLKKYKWSLKCLLNIKRLYHVNKGGKKIINHTFFDSVGNIGRKRLNLIWRLLKHRVKLGLFYRSELHNYVQLKKNCMEMKSIS